MGSEQVTVVIPVGPEPQHVRWLAEAVQSVREQTYPVSETLLIDDMQGLSPGLDEFLDREGITVWPAPWRLGIATAFNIGVALAANELVFMLGSDDRLLPQCIEACVRAYHETAEDVRDQTYYAAPVQYSDGRPDQFLPCNAALVTKGLWQHCGGFPLETASGAPDAALISIFMRHPEAGTYIVVGRKPLYWYRSHDATDTARRGPWQPAILATRDLVTQLWEPPRWTVHAGWTSAGGRR